MTEPESRFAPNPASGRDPRPLCIDLFCGYGGWARGFLDAGYRVIGFDNEPKCAKRYPGEFVLADVRNLDGVTLAHQYGWARVVVASPPCEWFSTAMNFNLRRGLARAPEKGMILVREAIRVIQEAEPRYWAIENVQGAVQAISSELGPPIFRKHSQFLWGRFPGFMLPSSGRLMKYHSVETRKGSHDGWHGAGHRRGRETAIIPYPLARALAEACLPDVAPSSDGKDAKRGSSESPSP